MTKVVTYNRKTSMVTSQDLEPLGIFIQEKGKNSEKLDKMLTLLEQTQGLSNMV